MRLRLLESGLGNLTVLKSDLKVLIYMLHSFLAALRLPSLKLVLYFKLKRIGAESLVLVLFYRNLLTHYSPQTSVQAKFRSS